MRGGRSLAVAGLLALVLGACSSSRASAARRAADQRFVDGVHMTATDIGKYRTDSQLIRLGHATCDGFQAHANIEQIAGVIEQTASALPPADVGAIISAAVKYLCPAYGGSLNPVSRGG